MIWKQMNDKEKWFWRRTRSRKKLNHIFATWWVIKPEVIWLSRAVEMFWSKVRVKRWVRGGLTGLKRDACLGHDVRREDGQLVFRTRSHGANRSKKRGLPCTVYTKKQEANERTSAADDRHTHQHTHAQTAAGRGSGMRRPAEGSSLNCDLNSTLYKRQFAMQIRSRVFSMIDISLYRLLNLEATLAPLSRVCQTLSSTHFHFNQSPRSSSTFE